MELGEGTERKGEGEKKSRMTPRLVEKVEERCDHVL